MSDIIATLHPENDESSNLYPNIKKENIPDGSIDVSKLDSVLQYNSNIADFQVKDYVNSYYADNKYIVYSNGREDTLNNMHIIKVKVIGLSNILYRYTRTNPDIRGLAFYDVNENFISGVQATSSEQIISVPNGAYWCKATSTSLLDIITNINSFDLLDLINSKNYSEYLKLTNANLVSGKWIHYDNGIIDTLGSLKYLEFNVFEGDIFKYKYIKSGTLDSRGLAFYDINGIYLNGVQAISSEQTITVPNGASICKATVLVEDNIEYFKNLNNLNKELNLINERISNYDILYSYDNITCLGDSLTYGVVYTSQTNTRIAKKPYPSILQQKYGINVENISRGGATSLSWWNEFNSRITTKNNQLIILWLGTNGGLSDTLEQDAPESVPYTEWASTNTGSYAKIVAKSIECGSKIILVNTYNDSTNEVIKKIADRFNCGLIINKRLSALKYHYYPNLTGYNNLHYNDLGYSALANYIIYNINNMTNDYMKNIIPL